MFSPKIKSVIATLLSVIVLISFSCCVEPVDKIDDGSPNDGTEEPTYDSCCTFFDVGNGECVLVNLPDGKNLLVDCGEKNDTVTEKIGKIINDNCGGKVDYFVYTHPDSEHTGNAEYLLNNAQVGVLYMPKIVYPNDLLFPEYTSIKALAEEKGVEIIYPDMYKHIKGDGYAIAFLTPEPFSGSYVRFNGNDSVSGSDVNNLSPIIYLDLFGVRFVFTGDAEKIEEQVVVEYSKINFYNSLYKNSGITVDLENVDYLKVSNGGANEGSSKEFLDLLKAKAAVVSVAGNNYYGHPTSTVLKRLQNANENYRILRTDVSGTIRVFVNADGSVIEKKGD